MITAADARGGGGGGGRGGGGGFGGGARSFSGGGGGISRSFSAPSRSFSAPSRSFAAPSRSFSAPSRSFAAPSRVYSAPRAVVRSNSGGSVNRNNFAGTGNRNPGVSKNAITQNAARSGLASRQWQGNRSLQNAQGNQRFGLASVAGTGASRAIANRMLANRPGAGKAFARAAFTGHFASWAGNHRHFRRFAPFFVIGWWGPLYWPYAYDDFVEYTFYPHAYDSFWPYAYDDLYADIYGRYAYGSDSSSGNAGPTRGKPAVTASLCGGETSAGLTDWPIDQIAQTVEPNETQRAALEGLRSATAQALDILKAACPTDLASTPTGRLEGMRKRLEVMLAAVRTVRPALETFYHSLSDEQKARFNTLGPDESPDQQQAQRDLAQMCSERASGIASLPVDRIETAVRPNDVQRAALTELRDAMAGAVNLLKSDCPTYRALTPAGRVEAMEQRLDAMMRAVQMVQGPLDKFYASLSDEQKERFNRLGPPQQS